MFINKVSLGTGAMDVSSNDNFGLTLERNINARNKFYAEVTGITKTTNRIMWL